MTDTVGGLGAVLAIQEHDTVLDQLRQRRLSLPQRATLVDLRAQADARDARAAAVGEEQGGLDGRRGALEAEVASLDQRLRDLDRRLRSGEVTATRELTAMVDQSDALKRRRSGLEDEELELMVALEPLEEELGDLAARGAELAGQIDLRAAELGQAESVIDTELAEVLAARATAATAVPGDLLAAYERLRGRLGGIGAARLVGSSCGGCHLTLSATELDHIRRQPPDALITCDQCGRILVR
jgi:predicted  nucleic acid-binding Zn-ribbon protein